jgi:hypothetical protein
MTSIDESHDRSVKVIEEYNNEGKPFVLYLRKFSFNVWHGKDDINRYLTDNYIESNLPQGVNLISIQEPGDSMTFFRKVPSLHLTDTSWQCVVEEPIKIADIIVSECYMLSPRVTYEMTNCIRYNKYHQTVLILPPPKDIVKEAQLNSMNYKQFLCILVLTTKQIGNSNSSYIPSDSVPSYIIATEQVNRPLA